MMRIAELVKKDFLLMRKSVLALLCICVACPLLMTLMIEAQGKSMSAFAFIYMGALSGISFMQNAAAAEEKSPKAAALICAAPYARRSFVAAKYISYLLFCLGSIAVYSLAALLYSGLEPLSLVEVALVLFIGALLHGINTPVVLKYGAAKARIMFVCVILLCSFGPLAAGRLLRIDIERALTLAQELPASLAPILLGAAVAVMLFSLAVSGRIFAKKDL